MNRSLIASLAATSGRMGLSEEVSEGICDNGSKNLNGKQHVDIANAHPSSNKVPVKGYGKEDDKNKRRSGYVEEVDDEYDEIIESAIAFLEDNGYEVDEESIESVLNDWAMEEELEEGKVTDYEGSGWYRDSRHYGGASHHVSTKGKLRYSHDIGGSDSKQRLKSGKATSGKNEYDGYSSAASTKNPRGRSVYIHGNETQGYHVSDSHGKHDYNVEPYDKATAKSIFRNRVKQIKNEELEESWADNQKKSEVRFSRLENRRLEKGDYAGAKRAAEYAEKKSDNHWDAHHRDFTNRKGERIEARKTSELKRSKNEEIEEGCADDKAPNPRMSLALAKDSRNNHVRDTIKRMQRSGQLTAKQASEAKRKQGIAEELQEGAFSEIDIDCQERYGKHGAQCSDKQRGKAIARYIAQNKKNKPADDRKATMSEKNC